MNWVKNPDVRTPILKIWADKDILPHYILKYYVTNNLVRFVKHGDLQR